MYIKGGSMELGWKENLKVGDRFTRKELNIAENHIFTSWQTSKKLFVWIEKDIWEYRKEI